MAETLEEAVERLLRSRIEQGFERQCSDPAVYVELAALVRQASGDRKREILGARSSTR